MAYWFVAAVAKLTMEVKDFRMAGKVLFLYSSDLLE